MPVRKDHATTLEDLSPAEIVVGYRKPSTAEAGRRSIAFTPRWLRITPYACKPRSDAWVSGGVAVGVNRDKRQRQSRWRGACRVESGGV
jgi:hypothetical protein